MGDGQKLLTHLNSALKVLLGLDIFPRVPKKKLNFVDQCYQYFPLPVIFVMYTACRFPVNYLTLKWEHSCYGNRLVCIFQVAVKH